MHRVLVSVFVLVITTLPVMRATEPEFGFQEGAWFCSVFAEWKSILRRDYPDADRSIPDLDRRCHQPREPIG